MAERRTPDPDAQSAPAKRGRRAIILAPLLFIAGAGGGYFGLKTAILPMFTSGAGETETLASMAKGITFIPLDPIVINLSTSESGRYLRFQGQIEVTESAQAEVTSLIPRLMDVLNSYLRAVDPEMLEDRSALVRLKAQMLRRLQMVAGSGKVRDLLVMEFVVS